MWSQSVEYEETTFSENEGNVCQDFQQEQFLQDTKGELLHNSFNVGQQ